MPKLLRLIIVLSCLTFIVGCAQETEDTTPPSTPANLVKTSPDNDNTPTFEWDAANDEDSGVSCCTVRIAGESWYQYWIFNGDSTSFDCEVPLSDGSHTFEVKAVDGSMNESAAASLTFKVDTSASVAG